MQPTPIIVTKTSAVNHSKSATNEAPNKEASEPFEKVLSKQVKHNEAQMPDTSSQDGNVKEAVAVKELVDETENDASQAETLLDKPVLTAEGVLQGRTVEAAIKEAAIKEAVIKEAASEQEVDAHLLAMETTSKTLEDVTDGEVNIQTQQNANDLQVPLTSMVAANSSAIDQTSTMAKVADSTPDSVQPQLIGQQERSGSAPGKGVIVDEQLIVETQERSGSAFGKDVAVDEQLKETGDSVKAAADITSMVMQAPIVKPPSPLAPSSLQAGASNMIPVPLGKSGWNEAISQKIVWMIGATEQSATLTLNPKDLGPLQVVINVNNEKADATFISENPEVRKALEEGMSTLRNAMGQTGVELGQANVNTSKQHQDFQQASKEYVASQGSRSGVEEETEQVNHHPLNIRVSNGLVDTFV